jgi:eukaryotic-like serine/threonine-protein kinase
LALCAKFAFGPFKFDLKSGRLEKHGHRVKLQPKSSAVLACLLENPGEIVSRDQLQKRLWPEGTYVDFDLSIKVAVKKLRDVLGDSSEEPVYIQTVRGEGYRFIASIVTVTAPQPVPLVTPGRSSSVSQGMPSTALICADPARRRRRAFVAALGATGLLAVSALVTLGLMQRPALHVPAHSWVLIAAFDNKTGDALMDGTLEYALQSELGSSQYVNVVQRERINDTLALMRKPANTRVDHSIAREVCLRDGNIRAVVTGQVGLSGGVYALRAELVDPVSGATKATFNETIDKEQSPWPAIHRLSGNIRRQLGEDIQQSRGPEHSLSQVTTPSMRALQLYSFADTAIADGKNLQAEELLKQAIKEDPQFASAYTNLAYAIANQNKASGEFLPHAERGLQLSKALPERERLFIEGNYYDLSGQRDRAIIAYENLLRIDPDNLWALNKINSYGRPQMVEQAVESIRKVADMRPTNFRANWYAAQALLSGAKTHDAAGPYLQRARALAPSAPPEETVWLDLLPAYEAWARGDVDSALRELAAAERNIGAQSPARREMLAGQLGNFYFGLGLLRRADELFRSLLGSSDPEFAEISLCELAWARGDSVAVRREFDAFRGSDVDGYYLPFLTTLGMTSVAEEVIGERGKNWEEKFDLDHNLGELALAKGKTAEAIPLLEASLPSYRSAQGVVTMFFVGSESLARAYAEKGDMSKAIQVLETASQERRGLDKRYATIIYPWLRTQFALAQMYRRVGRIEDARTVEVDLLKLLAHADADHPILRELQKRSTTTAVSSRKGH